MQGFITAMGNTGINVNMLSILFSNDSQYTWLQGKSIDETEHSFGISLPLHETVKEIGHLLETDLANENVEHVKF